MKQLKTFISPVYGRTPIVGAELTGRPDEITLKLIHGDKGGCFWLDEMLNGGLALPDEVWPKKSRNYTPPDSSFVLLVAGPPGSGKSSFSLELCINLAKNAQADGTKWSSIYCSAESSTQRILENARSFGWDYQWILEHTPGTTASYDAPCCVIYGCGDESAPGMPADPYDFLSDFINDWKQNIRIQHPQGLGAPDVVVIDSLNTIKDAGEFASMNVGFVYRQIIANLIHPGGIRPRLLILILDGFSSLEPANSWEYLADAAFRFDAQIGAENFYQRTFQIVKIRTQSHVWGRHAFKIYPGQQLGVRERDSVSRYARTYKAPYLETGATFIFPSIHWHVARSIKESPIPNWDRRAFYPMPLHELNEILASDAALQGMPAKNTTVFVGSRGGMKSHLAFYFCLSHALGHPSLGKEKAKNVLIVSLRDDVEDIAQTLAKIVDENELTPGSSGEETVKRLLTEDRLGILYNWPGYTTPEEFFHRMYTALNRERNTNAVQIGNRKLDVPERDTAEVLILDGLDHLEAKFPLWTKEKTFVPALTSLLRCYKVCTVVNSSHAESRDPSWTDIRPMADLVLEFNEATTKDLERVRDGNPNVTPEVLQPVKIAATRVPAGQIGGHWGILARDAQERLHFWRNTT